MVRLRSSDCRPVIQVRGSSQAWTLTAEITSWFPPSPDSTRSKATEAAAFAATASQAASSSKAAGTLEGLTSSSSFSSARTLQSCARDSEVKASSIHDSRQRYCA